jgi:hypothetical protein
MIKKLHASLFQHVSHLFHLNTHSNFFSHFISHQTVEFPSVFVPFYLPIGCRTCLLSNLINTLAKEVIRKGYTLLLIPIAAISPFYLFHL